MKNALYSLLAIVCGIAFYFTIIGVFEFMVACVSLALFICAVLCAWIFERAAGADEAPRRSADTGRR